MATNWLGEYSIWKTVRRIQWTIWNKILKKFNKKMASFERNIIKTLITQAFDNRSALNKRLITVQKSDSFGET